MVPCNGIMAKSLCTAKSRGYILGDHECPIYNKYHPLMVQKKSEVHASQ